MRPAISRPAGGSGRSAVIQGSFVGGRLPAPAAGRAAGSAPHLVQAAPAHGARQSGAVQLSPDADLRPLGPPQRLPEVVQRRMESLFAADFSDVRVHVSPGAAALGALALTRGSDLFFAPGRYDPASPHGQRLIAHELAHVLQQRAGRVRNPFGAGTAVVHDPGLEAEAERMSLRALAVAAQPAAPAAPRGAGPRSQTAPTALPARAPRPVAQPPRTALAPATPGARTARPGAATAPGSSPAAQPSSRPTPVRPWTVQPARAGMRPVGASGLIQRAAVVGGGGGGGGGGEEPFDFEAFKASMRQKKLQQKETKEEKKKERAPEWAPVIVHGRGALDVKKLFHTSTKHLVADESPPDLVYARAWINKAKQDLDASGAVPPDLSQPDRSDPDVTNTTGDGEVGLLAAALALFRTHLLKPSTRDKPQTFALNLSDAWGACDGCKQRLVKFAELWAAEARARMNVGVQATLVVTYHYLNPAKDFDRSWGSITYGWPEDGDAGPLQHQISVTVTGNRGGE